MSGMSGRIVIEGSADNGEISTGGDFSGTDLSKPASQHGAGMATVLYSNGVVTTVVFGYDRPAGGCSYWGHAFSS